MPLINGVGITKTDSQTMKSESNIKNDNSYQHHDVLASLIKVKQSTLAMTTESEQDRLSKQKKALLNKSIAPLIASKLLTCVQFNGFGKIISLTMPLKDSDFNLLINNTITPLTETPVLNRENTNISCDIQKEFLEKIKYLFLSDDLSNESLNLLVKKLIDYIEPDHPVIKKMNELINNIEKGESIHITKHNDNYYGRTFDSLIAELTVTQPTTAMDNCIAVIIKEINNDFFDMTEKGKYHFIGKVCDRMINDKAPWFDKIPEAKNFLKSSSADDFIKMMNTTSPLKNLLIMFLSIKILLCTPAKAKLMQMDTNPFYYNTIIKQRNIKDSPMEDVTSSRTGIKLFYQMQGGSQDSKCDGVRPIDIITLQTKKLSTHNKLAHRYEKPVVIGMSGSSNVLKSFFKILKSKEHFDIDEAQFLAACVFVYSGGHSINEAYTVFNYNEKEPFSPINYWSLSQSNASIKNIMDSAYEHLINEAMKLNVDI